MLYYVIITENLIAALKQGTFVKATHSSKSTSSRIGPSYKYLRVKFYVFFSYEVLKTYFGVFF